MRPRPILGAAVLTGLLAGAVASAGAQAPTTGVVGPAIQVTNNGRHLQPFGAPVTLGNFPTGGAVTPDGRFYWTVDAGRGPDDVRIVSTADRRVVQILRLPGASGGIAIDPQRPLVYVSGVPDSPYRDQRVPPGTPGAGGDVIHVFRYDPADGRAAFDHLISVPPPPGTPVPQLYNLGLPSLGPPTPQNFPPTNIGQKASWPDRLAVSPDGQRLLVPLNLADRAAVVDVASRTVRYVATGNYPYGAAISRDGRRGFVSNETPGTISVIDMASASKLRDIQVGAHLSHPEAVLADPFVDRIYVTLTNADEIAVVDARSLQLTQTLSVTRPEGLGTSPVALAVTPDGSELLAAESGADEIAAFSLPHPGSTAPDWSLIGRIPTSQYPTDVQTIGPALACDAQHKAQRRHRRHGRQRRHRHKRKRGRRRTTRRPAAAVRCSKLLYVTGKALGVGPNPLGPQPSQPTDTDNRINETQYLPLLNIGEARIGDLPSPARLDAFTAVADAQVRPSNPAAPPLDTPLRPGGPIKHVFYIVRENRTYDQVLGDDPRGDGAPALALFGGATTPNVHALVRRFPLVDHFYANSEASIDGHFWTSAAYTSDYVHKNWFQNYAGRNRPYDFGAYAVTWPGNGFLFNQATRQNISFFNYGEVVAGLNPLPDKDRTAAELAEALTTYRQTDTGIPGLPVATPAGSCYPNDTSIGKDSVTGQAVFDGALPAGAPPASESRYACFAARFGAQLAAGNVPSFNYLVLSNDHTRVLDPGAYTPRAMIADNDRGLGQLVDLISHSSIWNSSAIFVTEDDSQDGPDHVDAHRTVGLVISPFTRAGAVVHTRYDMLSMIRSMELIMGMRPLYLTDALATPMYDAFQGTPSNSAPFTALAPTVDLLAKNPPVAGAAARRLRFRGLDRLTQFASDRLLWRSVYGPRSVPPRPGPNAVLERPAGRD